MVRIVAMAPAHVDELIPVHLDAFRGHMNSRLGPRYARALITWFMAAERGIALVATEDDGRVLGYVAGAPDGYGRDLTRALLPVAAMSALRRPWLLVDREIRARAAARVRGLFRRHGATPDRGEAGTMALVAIGVASASRGQHVGAALIGAFEQRARALGMHAVRLSVYEDNLAARRLYERAGWTLVRTDGRALYFGRRLS